MDSPAAEHSRYFTSYSGVKLPLNLVNEIEAAEIENRNTYFRGFYDADGRMLGCEKRVYGEVEFSHRYSYYPGGKIQRALITMAGDEAQQLDFAE